MTSEYGTETKPPIEMPPGFSLGPTFGAVCLKDWMYNPLTGQNVICVCGDLSLIEAKKDFGFTPKGNETNWAVEVGGLSNKNVIILGCQIRAIYYGTSFTPNPASAWDLR